MVFKTNLLQEAWYHTAEDEVHAELCENLMSYSVKAKAYSYDWSQ